MKRASRPSLTAVRGLRVGQVSDPHGETGVSVIVFPKTARGAAEARGGAPGTMHTDALAPLGCFGILSAVFLTGGSLYGLDAARGIRRAVLAEGGGSNLWGAHDRIVGISGAVLFDLPRAHAVRADYEELGYDAARRASTKPVESGSVGAGTGATVGKMLGREQAMSGGVGSWATSLPGGFHLGALAAVNSVGNVVDPSTGRVVAGARLPKGGFASAGEAYRRFTAPRGGGDRAPRGTTLAVVVTDLPLSRRDMSRVAQSAHDGIARAVVPAHSSTDGDTVFVVSTGQERGTPVWPGGEKEPYPGALADLVGAEASACVASAILDGVRSARGRPGLPAVNDL